MARTMSRARRAGFCGSKPACVRTWPLVCEPTPRMNRPPDISCSIIAEEACMNGVPWNRGSTLVATRMRVVDSMRRPAPL